MAALAQAGDGRIVGVGLELSMLVVPGSPADRAGLRLGDRIVRVDGVDVVGLGADKLVALTRGPAGGVVRVAVVRDGRELVLELTRESPGRSVAHEHMTAEQRKKRMRQYDLDEESAITLSISRDAPREQRLVARETFAAPPLSTHARVTHHELHVDEAIRASVGAAEFKLCNPSLAWHDGKLRCCVRSLNYWITERGYVIREADRGIIKTQNFLGRIIPRDWTLTEVTPMRDLATRAGRYDHTGVLGYEDVRLFSLGGRLGASATICDGTPNARPNEQRQIVVLDLDTVGNVLAAHIQHTDRKHEKNWMPLVERTGILGMRAGERLSWVYQSDPTIVRGYAPEAKTSAEVSRSVPPFALDHMRGGAVCPLLEGDGYLGLVHEVQYYVGVYTYVHRFVRFDSKLRIVAVSRPWHFQHVGIEFGAGLVNAITRDGEVYVCSYGLLDASAWLAVVQAEDVHRMVGL